MKNIISLLFILISLSVQSQYSWSTKNKKAIKYVKNSRLAIQEQDPNTGGPYYQKAIDLCNKAIAKDENFIEAYLVKADYATSLNQFNIAIEAYRKTIDINPRYSRTGYIFSDLANLEWIKGEYNEALAHAKHFKKIPDANKDKFNEINWLIANCEFAINAINNPLKFSPKNLGTGVNTEYAEYFSTLTVDQKSLLFTREIDIQPRSGRGQEDFFISNYNDNEWQTAVPLPRNINTSNNEGAPTFAPDGRTLIFVGCIDQRGSYGSNRRGYGSCDLFITKKTGNRWSDPINLPGAVNTVNWETQPSLSSDGKTLFFIRGSSRPINANGDRKGDIYMSKLRSDGKWGAAERLPNHINTPQTESSVLIHPDGKTLYFSSNGHIGMGGFDLFMTQIQPDGTWEKPRNLGYPINSNKNENSLLVFANGQYAVFASNREGGFGKTDLYGFEMPESIQPTRTLYMSGLVYNKITKDKLESNFTLIDLSTGKEIIQSKSDPLTGEFIISLPVNREYALSVSKANYQPYSINFNLVSNQSNEPYHQDIPMIPISNNSEENILSNVFFDIDSYALREKSFIELDLLVKHLKKNSKMVIELQGHTDAQGDAEHNLTLSSNRAKAVMLYLIEHGIEETRLSSKGYGETKPTQIIDSNGQSVKLTEAYINTIPEANQIEAHQQNRRTAYIVK